MKSDDHAELLQMGTRLLAAYEVSLRMAQAHAAVSVITGVLLCVAIGTDSPLLFVSSLSVGATNTVLGELRHRTERGMHN
jgi:ABC-type spermidine/putrescine transport system permease subunit II